MPSEWGHLRVQCVWMVLLMVFDQMRIVSHDIIANVDLLKIINSPCVGEGECSVRLQKNYISITKLPTHTVRISQRFQQTRFQSLERSIWVSMTTRVEWRSEERENCVWCEKCFNEIDFSPTAWLRGRLWRMCWRVALHPVDVVLCCFPFTMVIFFFLSLSLTHPVVRTYFPVNKLTRLHSILGVRPSLDFSSPPPISAFSFVQNYFRILISLFKNIPSEHEINSQPLQIIHFRSDGEWERIANRC